MIRTALALLALALADEAVGCWRHDRRLNGRDRRRHAHWLLLAARIGRPLAPALRRLPAPPAVASLQRSGVAGQLAADDLAAARAGSLATFTGIGAIGAISVGAGFGVPIAIACAVFGWCGPDLWLRSAAQRRAERIEREAPLALDLISAAVAAGIPLDHAIAAARDAVGDPLRGELEQVTANLALGRRRGDELRELGTRTDSPSLARLASALRISDRLGVPLADGLRRQAVRARAERSRLVQERAARAAPRILLVVVFVLVPAAMLPVMTALALSAAGSLAHLA